MNIFGNIVLLGVLLLIYKAYIWYNVRYIVSTLDKSPYKVIGGFDDAQRAADALAQLNINTMRLINFMLARYSEPGTQGYILASRLHARYNPATLEENNPSGTTNTSYTENKGDRVAMCLREKQSGKNHLHDQSILEYVNLHELAHIASESYGHEDEFWNNFVFLLDAARQANIHIPQDYKHQPINYCGVDVSYNPYYDL